MSAPIISTAYNTLKNGGKFVREMVIAINPESNGSIIVLTGASFSSTTFSSTTLFLSFNFNVLT